MIINKKEEKEPKQLCRADEKTVAQRGEGNHSGQQAMADIVPKCFDSNPSKFFNSLYQKGR